MNPWPPRHWRMRNLWGPIWAMAVWTCLWPLPRCHRKTVRTNSGGRRLFPQKLWGIHEAEGLQAAPRGFELREFAAFLLAEGVLRPARALRRLENIFPIRPALPEQPPVT